MSEEPRQRFLRLREEWNKHRFRKGEYFDRYLYRLLDKYDLSLDEYYRFGRELDHEPNTGVC